MPRIAGRQNKDTWKLNQGSPLHNFWRSTSLTPLSHTHVRIVFGNVSGSMAEFRNNVSGAIHLSTLHTHTYCADNPLD
jgi:hypothetical protein